MREESKFYIPMNRKNMGAILTLAIYLLSLCAAVFPQQVVAAAAPAPAPAAINNGLSIEPLAAYNAIVDSNVLSPSSYGPSAISLGAKFCNTSPTDLQNVQAYIGQYYSDTPPLNPIATPTPGTYPVRSPAQVGGTLSNAIATDYGDTTRLFAIEQEAGSVSDSVDATRWIGLLKASECRTQYWLVSYPRVAVRDSNINGLVDITDERVTVTNTIKPEDDLWLEYDIWATSTTLTNSTATSSIRRSLTMRNEISAMANKIWPNGDNKVPEDFRDMVTKLVGWETITPSNTSSVYPGEKITSEGIWYDLGNVGAGFDNNLDFVPDRNLFLQPIGDQTSYDPGCFRLVGSHGLLVIKLNDGTNQVISFADRLYFDNIPENNIGAVGLVYYDYISLDGACTASLTPYQEVASGYDNEKFNADFGTALPPLQTKTILELPGFNFTKSGTPGTIELSAPANPSPPTIQYTIDFTFPRANISNPTVPVLSIGMPSIGMPLVIEEAIPDGLQFVSLITPNPVVANNAADGAIVFYSTDSGLTWSTTLPNPVPISTKSNLFKIQWRLPNSVSNQDSDVRGVVSFTAKVPDTYFIADPTRTPVINNNSCLKLGQGDCFADATATNFVKGSNYLAGTVYRDDGVGTSTILANGIKETAEIPIAGASVSLYYDTNGNGKLDLGEPQVGSPITGGADGTYSFGTAAAPTLPDGKYIVVVNTETAIPTAYGPTTPTARTTDLDSARAVGATVAATGLDFGFAPPLIITKDLYNTPASVTGGDLVTYRIGVKNVFPGDGSSDPYCKYNVWTSTPHPNNASTTPIPKGGGNNAEWFNPTNVTGAPDKSYSYTTMRGNVDLLGLSGLGTASLGGNISKVELVMYLRERVNLVAGDSLTATVYYNNLASASVFSYNETLFPGPVGSERMVRETIPVSVTGHANWLWSDVAAVATPESMIEVLLTANGSSNAAGDIELDAAGLIITTDQICSNTSSILNPVPLTDTYNKDLLTFLSASPVQNASAPAAGTLEWSNLGPLYPGQTRYVTVTFLASSAATGTARNTATSTGTLFASGRPANSPVTAFKDVAITVNTNTAIISGTVWNDLNANGWFKPTGYQASPTDNFIGNVRVNLYTCLNSSTYARITAGSNSPCGENGGIWTIVDSTTTSAAGLYTFDKVQPGFYRVGIDTSNFLFNAQTGDYNQQPTGNTTNLICTTCDNFAGDDNIALNNAIVPGATGINFGYTQYNATGLQIPATVYYDQNINGLQDPGEGGIPDVQVKLYNALTGALVATQNTTSTGAYTFTNLPSGVYSVEITPFNNALHQTGDPSEAGVCVTCDGQSLVRLTTVNAADQKFGYILTTGSYSLGDTVFIDRNADGVQSAAGESGIANVTVRLWADLTSAGSNSYNLLKETTTSATGVTGSYLFSGLPAGAYRVTVDPTQPAVDNTFDQLYDSTTLGAVSGTFSGSGSTSYLSLDRTMSNANITTADFGLTERSSIGDTVYWDANGNSEQDVDEEGIAGVTLYLHRFVDSPSGDGQFQVGEAILASIQTTTTDASGHYSFTGLPVTAGSNTYLVAVDRTSAVISGKTLTADPDTSGETCTTTPEPWTGFYASCDAKMGVTLNSGSIYTGADFGFQPTGAFGDTLWIDSNGDNIRQASEPGIPYATVKVIGTGIGASCLAPTGCTTTTDANGNYSFSRLNDGAYTVTVDTAELAGFPAGLVNSYDPDGGANSQANISIVGGLLVNPVGSCSTGSCSLEVDFGYRYPPGPGFISGTICIDGGLVGVCGSTASGVDPGEVPFENVPVYLYTWVDVTSTGLGTVQANELKLYATTTSDENGDYHFNNVAVNSYYVVVINAPLEKLDLTTTTGSSPDIGDDLYEQVVESNPTPNTADTQVYQVIKVRADSVPATDSDTTVTNIDFAFQSTLAYDYGDLPSEIEIATTTVNTSYGTNLGGSPDGARHLITPSLFLGTVLPDSEGNGLSTLDATGDNANTNNDEDGVGYSSNWRVKPEVYVTIHGDGYLVAWVDFNADGDFDDKGEKIIDQPVKDTSTDTDPTNSFATFIFTLPADRVNGSVYARFRLFPSAPLFSEVAYAGAASGGEVEDYFWNPFPTAVTIYDFMTGPTEGGVRLTWATAAEIDNLGFNLYRQPAEGGDFVLLNPEIIPSLVPGQILGAEYEWLDTSADLQAQYVYRLEAIDIYGGIQQFETRYQPATDPTSLPFKLRLPLVTR